MEETQSTRREYRSMFWPMILIGAGILFLLQNSGVLPGFNWSALLRFWPVLLILAGIDVLLARSAPALGAVLGLAVIGGVVAMIILYPPSSEDSGFSFPIFVDEREATDYRFEAPLEGAEAAEVSISLGLPRTEIGAISNPESNLLAQVSIRDVFTPDFEDRGSGSERQIDLRSEGVEFGIGPDNFFPLTVENLYWDIQLNPRVLYDMEVDASAGSAIIDLSELRLSALNVEASAGSMILTLPGGDYDAEISGSAGSTNVSFAPESNVRLRVEPSVGSMSFTVPRGAALRVIVEEGGIGSLGLPSQVVRVQPGADSDDDEAGIYETENVNSASMLIEITIPSISVGSVSINLD